MFDEEPTNPTDTETFADIMKSRIGRRQVIAGGFAGAAAFIAAGGTADANDDKTKKPGSLGFDPIDTSDADGISLPPGYTAQVICPAGDPLQPSGPAYKPDLTNDSTDQLLQFGQGHDGISYFPRGRIGQKSKTGILAMNHEYTTKPTLFPDASENWSPEKTLKEEYAHGVSIAEVKRNNDGSWQTVDSKFARRITPHTTCDFSGPAKGHDLLKTDFDPTGMTGRGILNQCGNGYTPWGTYLTTEENFNGYFWDGAASQDAEGNSITVPSMDVGPEQQALNDRYGVSGFGFGYLWAATDTKYRADIDKNAPNTHGWIVEIDPYDPYSNPVKHTALGRFKHEGAAFAVGWGGKAVVYSGDDQRFDYLYKFVGANNWHSARQMGESPLAEGTLYVAKFNGDGTGEWIPLIYGQGPLTEANGFSSQGDVLIKTRLAADAVGATPMDRPEWTTVHPWRRGEGYVTCTNNSRRGRVDEVDANGVELFEATPGRLVPSGPNAANPRSPNNFGHIIKWNEDNKNPASTTFHWDFFVISGAGDGTDGSTNSPEALHGSPDGLWVDHNGRMWIQTDGSQPDGSNNQMLVADLNTGEIKRFFVGPPGCEVTGVTMTPDGTTMFINIQHPGFPGFRDSDPITSLWPYMGNVPRAATIAIRKVGGGIIGT